MAPACVWAGEAGEAGRRMMHLRRKRQIELALQIRIAGIDPRVDRLFDLCALILAVQEDAIDRPFLPVMSCARMG
jgi:hypothetical protein